MTGWGHADSLMLTGQAQEYLGQDALALETYRALYSQEPLSPASEKVKEALHNLAHKLKTVPLTMQQSLDRVDKLIAATSSPRPVRTGTASDRKPISSSSSLLAYPLMRTSSISLKISRIAKGQHAATHGNLGVTGNVGCE